MTGRKPIPIEPYIDKLEQALLLGATYELAAMYAGISKRTFQRWRADWDAATDGTPLAVLRDRLRAAEGRAALGWLALIEQAARNGDWRAAWAKLQHRYPESYARTFTKIAFTTPDGTQPWEGTQGLAALLDAAKQAAGEPPRATANGATRLLP